MPSRIEVGSYVIEFTQSEEFLAELAYQLNQKFVEDDTVRVTRIMRVRDVGVPLLAVTLVATCVLVGGTGRRNLLRLQQPLKNPRHDFEFESWWRESIQHQQALECKIKNLSTGLRVAAGYLAPAGVNPFEPKEHP